MSSTEKDDNAFTVHPAFAESVPRLLLPFVVLLISTVATIFHKSEFFRTLMAVIASLALLRAIVVVFAKSIPRLILPVTVFIISIVTMIAYKSDYAQTMVAIIGLLVLIYLTGLLLKVLIDMHFTTYVFTSEEISSSTGVFHTTKSKVRVVDIRGVTIRKTLLGRILGYASAEIGTAATGGAELKVDNVRDLENILKERGILQTAD